MNKILLKCLFIISVAVFSTACTTIKKSCLFGNCYGPFEIILKTTNNEHVEDVLITLSHGKSPFINRGITYTYKETLVVKTNEVITFPRGYVGCGGGDDCETVRLSGRIHHPDFVLSRVNFSFPADQEGVIDLGEMVMRSNQELRGISNKNKVAMWLKEGKSQQEIEERLKDKKVVTPADRFNNSYFATAISIGREDIVDKYLPGILKDYYEYKGFNEKEAAEFEQKVRNNIRKEVDRL